MGIQEVTTAYLVLANGLGCYAFPDTILKHSGQRRPEETGLVDDGSNYLQAYGAIAVNLQNWRHIKEIVAALQVLNPSIRGVDIRVPSHDVIVVSHAVNGQLLPLYLDQESEGFRRLLAYLIALYQSPSKQTLIFDEPEKGLYPVGLDI